jgi:hypothetical protein
LLASFDAAAAAMLPPFVLMSSCADHMVPWHEAAEMAVALRLCGVAAKQLIYDRSLHNDFVLDWTVLPAATSAVKASSHLTRRDGITAPLATAAAPPPAAAAAAGKQLPDGVSGTDQSRPGSAVNVANLPACAKDLINIVTGRAQLVYDTAKVEHLAAAVSALEVTAGVASRAPGATGGLPMPASRL